MFSVKWELNFSILFGLIMSWPVSIDLLTLENVCICDKGIERDVLAKKLRLQVVLPVTVHMLSSNIENAYRRGEGGGRPQHVVA